MMAIFYVGVPNVEAALRTGATEAEIANITGHSLRDVHAILDMHYLARDPALGENAIRRLERKERRTKPVK